MTRKWSVLIAAAAAVCLLIPGCLMAGAVDIPAADVWKALCGGEPARKVWRAIVCDIRLPMTLCALLSGMALAVSGLLMQTLFRNPLAGPSIMGIS
ncbi:MAG: iron ABC transporter permease, partial [Muribaculaceae bacterium]|nr:iron ABC transporter permease [Muribaculaceae bacterium]